MKVKNKNKRDTNNLNKIDKTRLNNIGQMKMKKIYAPVIMGKCEIKD